MFDLKRARWKLEKQMEKLTLEERERLSRLAELGARVVATAEGDDKLPGFDVTPSRCEQHWWALRADAGQLDLLPRAKVRVPRERQCEHCEAMAFPDEDGLCSECGRPWNGA